MTEDILDLLRRHDDPVCWEFPADYDRVELDRRFSAFVGVLRSALDCAFDTETGAYIQDASFFAQVMFRGGSLRFSNFGYMVAFTPDHEIPDPTVSLVADVAAQAGYRVVPTPVLETPYTGRNRGVTGIRTWWIRFFDYV